MRTFEPKSEVLKRPADESTEMISMRESKPLSKEPMRTFEPKSEVLKRLKELKRQPVPEALTQERQTMRTFEPMSEVLSRGKPTAAATNENRATQSKK